MTPIRYPRFLLAKLRRRRAKAARARRLSNELELFLNRETLRIMRQWVNLQTAAASHPILVQAGTCVLCGEVTVLLRSLPSISGDGGEIKSRFVAACVDCQTSTVMVGAGNATSS